MVLRDDDPAPAVPCFIFNGKGESSYLEMVRCKSLSSKNRKVLSDIHSKLVGTYIFHHCNIPIHPYCSNIYMPELKYRQP